MEKQVLLLRVELELLKKKFERTEKLLEKAEFERDSSSKYVESFREQVSQLHEKLAAEKKKNENVKNHEQEERGLSIHFLFLFSYVIDRPHEEAFQKQY